MKSFYFLTLILLFSANANAQTTTVDRIDTVHVYRKSVNFKTIGLYDSQYVEHIETIGRFKALTIFDNELGSQFWASEEPTCIQFGLRKEKNETAILNVKWDKIAGGCKWIGIGFGWDYWQPKDLSDIVDSAEIVLYVSTLSDTLNHLPLAFAFEDYSGKQCYTGFNRNYLSSKILPNQWSTVRIPLNKFPFMRSKVNPDQIKQFVIQFEAEGQILIDKIKIEKSKPTS